MAASHVQTLTTDRASDERKERKERQESQKRLAAVAADMRTFASITL